MITRRLLVALALALGVAVIAITAGCGDDDRDGGPDSAERTVELTFAGLPGDQELSLEVAPVGADGTAAFADSEPEFGGELTAENLTQITGNTLEMQTFAPLGEGSMTLGLVVSGEVTMVELSVQPVPQDAAISVGEVGGTPQTVENGAAVFGLS